MSLSKEAEEEKAAKAASQGSSSSGSSGTLSSLDTLPTQELPSIAEEEEEEGEGEGEEGSGPARPWGRLLGLAPGFPNCDLFGSESAFGRDATCDYSFAKFGAKDSELFPQYSKRHFRVLRGSSEGIGTAFLEDESANGTFLDGKRVGRGRRAALAHGAEIALALPNNKVFLFYALGPDRNRPEFPRALREKYVVSRTLGTGACGEVRLGFEWETGREVAIKIINKRKCFVDNLPENEKPFNVENEVEILKKIDHPCLIKIKDFYEGEEDFYIVLELMEGGELFYKVRRPAKLREETAKLYFYQMLLAVQYLHEKGIIHRDLKLENVLLSSPEEKCLLKITDFGHSKLLGEASLTKTLCGTPDYLAPEAQHFALGARDGYGRAVDAWSLGVILFICLSGYPPFSGNARMSLREQISRGEFLYCKEIWDKISPEAFDLVRKLLTVDPERRPKIAEALQHPWLQDEEMKRTFEELVAREQSSSRATETPVLPQKSRRKRRRETDSDSSPKIQKIQQ